MKVINLDAQKSCGEVNKESVEKFMVSNNFSNILATFVFAVVIFSIALITSYFVLWLITMVLAICLFLILFFVTIATLGLVYLTTDFGKAWGWFDPMFNNAKTITDFLAKVYLVTPYLGIAALACSVVSIVLLAKGQNEHKVSKIVWLSICIAILVFCVIFEFATKGGFSS